MNTQIKYKKKTSPNEWHTNGIHISIKKTSPQASFSIQNQLLMMILNFFPRFYFIIENFVFHALLRSYYKNSRKHYTTASISNNNNNNNTLNNNTTKGRKLAILQENGTQQQHQTDYIEKNYMVQENSINGKVQGFYRFITT